MTVFHGRHEEIERMQSAERLPGAKLFVLMGRRRIGKSTLVDKFAQGQTFYQFMGLAPNKEDVSSRST